MLSINNIRAPSPGTSTAPTMIAHGPTDTDWGDFTRGNAQIGQGNYQALVQSLTHRELSIRRFDNGVIEVELKRADIEHLVLSGGGAKGVAYSGLVEALEAWQILDKIRSISGSPAGAVSAAFLASGMNHADFEKMSNETNLVSLLDSHNRVLRPIQHGSSTLGKGVAILPGKAGSIGQLLLDLLFRIKSEAAPLETLIHEKMLASIQGRFNQALDDPQRSLSQASRACVDKIKANGHVTFGDLATLSHDMPEIKQVRITGTAMLDGRPQMVVFNANLTPDMDVARAAHISSSLPIVFERPSEQHLPFQADAERTFFQNGGIMLNTPVMELYEPAFRMSAIPDSEQLILRFECENSGQKKESGTLFSVLADKFVGAPYSSREAQEADGMQAFADNIVTVPLKSAMGDFRGTLRGTVNFSMPIKHKNHLQQNLKTEVERYLRNHERSETYRFNAMSGALLALNDSLFEAAALELQNDRDCAAAIHFRRQAQQTLTHLKGAVIDASITGADALTLTRDIRTAIAVLDQLGDNPGKIDWLAKKLNDGNESHYMELLQAVKRMDARAIGQKSAVMSAAINEMGLRDIVTKRENFIREVIYPSLYRLGQPDSNITLLKQAIIELRQATSARDYNNALRKIADRYVSRIFPSTARPFTSTTVEQARAWLIPDR